MRIVIATGDTDLRLAIQLMLSEEPGINIIGSASDCDGLNALARSTLPDYVLLDWSLPGCNVEEILKDLNAMVPNIKLIIIGQQQRMKETALQSGAAEYLVIGDPPENLLDVIRKLNVD
jgi:DNA-binding NarL/FixJ family response regulator